MESPDRVERLALARAKAKSKIKGNGKDPVTGVYTKGYGSAKVSKPDVSRAKNRVYSAEEAYRNANAGLSTQYFQTNDPVKQKFMDDDWNRKMAANTKAMTEYADAEKAQRRAIKASKTRY